VENLQDISSLYRSGTNWNNYMDRKHYPEMLGSQDVNIDSIQVKRRINETVEELKTQSWEFSPGNILLENSGPDKHRFNVLSGKFTKVTSNRMQH
jgi:hypothetical protein